MEHQEELISLLQRLEKNQQQSLEGQQQSLALQKQQFEMVKVQFERAEKLQDRAEEMQASGASIMKTARRALSVVLPIVIVLIIYLSWLIFR